MTGCPSENVLAAFFEGRLPPAARAAVLGHIDCCSACAEVATELARAHHPRSSPPSLEDAAPVPGGGGPFLGNARFDLRRRLGAGGFGTVFEAWDRDRGALVALKLLKEQQGDALYRFKQEFRSLCTLAHPNLVTLYELHSEGRRWFFTMERVQGRDLLQHVRRAPAPAPAGDGEAGEGDAALNLTPESQPGGLGGPAGDGASPVPRSPPAPHLPLLCDALLQLTEGLLYLHGAGKLHRDIKPANILCTPEGRLVLLDFGLARELELGEGSGHLVGTPAYMSPEQAAVGPVGPATDWYSVGVVLYEALTGHQPFLGPPMQVLRQKMEAEAPPPAQEAHGLSRDLAALCVDLLRRDPAQRPEGEAVRERLLSIQARLSGSAAPGQAAVPARTGEEGRGLVGRAEHLAALAAACEATAAGQPVLVFCHGASGLGKSALCRHFLRGLGEAVVLSGRCYEHEQVPFKALDGVVDALSRYLERLPGGQAEALLPRDIAALCRLFPVLERVPAVQQAPGRHIADPQAAKRAAYGALRELLQRLTDRRRVVLYIDDLQWGDADSVGLLLEVLRAPDPAPILLLLSYRSEEEGGAVVSALRSALLDSLYAEVQRREVPVGELSPEDATVLVRRLLGAEAAQAEVLAAEGGGSPFFLGELVRYARTRAVPEERLTLEQVIAARVALLPEEAQRLLQALCVAGQPVERAVLARAVTGLQSEPKALALLRAGSLLRVRPGEREELLPYHDRIREAVVRGLAPAARRECHHLLALTLEQAGAGDAERLLYHFLEAGDLDGAARHAARAAAQARQALAFERTALLCRQALGLPGLPEGQRQDLRVWLAEALSRSGLFRESSQAYLTAAEHAVRDVAQGHRLRAVLELVTGGYDAEGRALLGQGLAGPELPLPRGRLGALLSFLVLRMWLLIRGTGFRERPESDIPRAELLRIDMYWSSVFLFGRIDILRAALIHTRGLLLALRAGEPGRIARLLAAEGIIYNMLGLSGPRWGAGLLERAGALGGRSADPEPSAFVAYGASFMARTRGEWARAVELLDRTSELCSRCTQSSYSLAATLPVGRLMSLFWQGDLLRLGSEAPVMVREAVERNNEMMLSDARLYGTWVVALCRDCPDEAEGILAEAMRRPPDDWPDRRPALAVRSVWESALRRCWLLLYRGQRERACAEMAVQWQQVLRHIMRGAPSFNRATVHYVRGLCALGAPEGPGPGPGGHARSLRVAARGARMLRREETAWCGALATILEAGIARREGRHAEALRLMAEAEARCTEAGMALHAACARWRRGQWLGPRRDDGRSLIEDAEAWMRGQGIRSPARMTDAQMPA